MQAVSSVMLLMVLATGMFPQVEVDAARILGVFSPPARSHYILGSRLMTELARKGHQVTMISSFGLKEPMKNYKDIVLSKDTFELISANSPMLKLQEKNTIQQFLHIMELGHTMTETALNATGVQQLLNSNEHFDLIIMEAFLNEAHAGLAHHFDAPLVVFSTIGANVWVNDYAMNPSPAAYVPEVLLGFPVQMSFTQRMTNFLVSTCLQVVHGTLQMNTQAQLLQQYFPGAPPLAQIIKDRTALVLLNSHASIATPKPSVPSMIEIGGFHVEDPKELPKELKEYLDNAKQGFVLFSMGSNLKSTMLPAETRNIIMKVLSELPHKILWKFEDENLPGKPDNVRISNWLPQNDILAHPNLRLFITHGGLLSTTEAIYHGVPVVGIPVFGDQRMNMANAQNLNIGKSVPFNELTYEKLAEATKEVLGNKIYRENARERSKLLRDQPLKPIDNAVFWVEYTLRHGYNKHLRTGATELAWYQVYLLDVLAVLATSAMLILSVICWVSKKVCCGKSKPKKYLPEKKKKQ